MRSVVGNTILKPYCFSRLRERWKTRRVNWHVGCYVSVELLRAASVCAQVVSSAREAANFKNRADTESKWFEFERYHSPKVGTQK